MGLEATERQWIALHNQLNRGEDIWSVAQKARSLIFQGPTPVSQIASLAMCAVLAAIGRCTDADAAFSKAWKTDNWTKG